LNIFTEIGREKFPTYIDGLTITPSLAIKRILPHSIYHSKKEKKNFNTKIYYKIQKTVFSF
jgi:hypothetical protein